MPLLIMLALASTAFASADAVLKRFAPVVLQRCKGTADYITNVDFDGNFNGADNWQNQPKFPLKAYAYTSAIETRTHWYLTYSFFHPRDWFPIKNIPGINHENDFEGALVVVEKALDRVILMETVAHRKMLRWTVDPALADLDDVEGPLLFEGERPILDVQKWKHPISAYTGDDLAGEKGVLYRYHGRAEQPVGNDDRDVSYDLVSLKDTIWKRRFEIGPTKLFGLAADFADGRYGCSFNGDDYVTDGADAPWFWGFDEGKLGRGEWFFDPAKAMRVHFPKQKDRFPGEYLQHPFKSEVSSRP